MPVIYNKPKVGDKRKIKEISKKYHKICEKDDSTFEDKEKCLKARNDLEVILKKEKNLIAKVIGQISKKCIYQVEVEYSKGKLTTILCKDEMHFMAEA